MHDDDCFCLDRLLCSGLFPTIGFQIINEETQLRIYQVLKTWTGYLTTQEDDTKRAERKARGGAGDWRLLRQFRCAKFAGDTT
jgi:hypothetical protein